MRQTAPLDVICKLLDARRRKDIDSAVSCYETNASVVVEPNKIVSGTDAVRAFTEQAMDLPIIFGARQLVEGEDIAMHYSEWTLTLPDGLGGVKELRGCTTDVLRKQTGGDWLVALDNAWGISVLLPSSSPSDVDQR